MWKISLYDARRKRARTVRTNVKTKDEVLILATTIELLMCNKQHLEGRENMTTVDVVQEPVALYTGDVECTFEEAILWLLQKE